MTGVVGGGGEGGRSGVRAQHDTPEALKNDLEELVRAPFSPL